MITIQEALQFGTDFLNRSGVPLPRRQAQELLAHTLKIHPLDLFFDLTKKIEETPLKAFKSYLERRGRKEPLAYIIGHVEFFGCRIDVNPSVLIPRQETEILVEKVAKTLHYEKTHGKILADLCTGSGAIAISLKKKFPSMRILGLDLSKQALQIAEKNASQNHVEVEFYEGDFLHPLKNLGQVDYLICNPPYAAEFEYMSLEDDVRLYEPKMAIVAGPTGLEFYERLARELPVHFRSNGRLFLEIGANQGADLVKIFKGPPWKRFHIEKDWAGKNRFISLEIE
jgi:release factor glutamine methyltransferase